MSKLRIVRRRPKGTNKAKGRMFEFANGIDDFLVKQAARENKTMVHFLEELITLRMNSKTLK